MSSTSNKNDVDGTFVLEGIGGENAYGKLKRYHLGVSLGTGTQNQSPNLHTDKTFLPSSPQGTTPFEHNWMWVDLETEAALNLGVSRIDTAGNPRIGGVAAKPTAQIRFLTTAQVGLKLHETTSESYMSEAFRSYLNEVNRTPEFADGLVTQNVKRFFTGLQQALSLKQVPNPQAMPGEENALSLVWQDKTYQLGVDVRPDGLIDWFWFDLVTDEYEGTEGASLSPLPLNLLKRLSTVFIGS